jgi:Predicted membrane protein (DUF2207)
MSCSMDLRSNSSLSDVRVEPDGSLAVTETMRVQSEGQEIRHGIHRDLATAVRTRPDGRLAKISYEVLWVSRDGTPTPFSAETVGGTLRICVCRTDQLLTSGAHEFVMSYRARTRIPF